MTHIGPIPEDQGEFSQWSQSSSPCPKCGSDQYYWTIWESSDGAYEDEKRKCTDCNYTLWIDGIDS
jgi:DNA-directed RNA polymerase subunit M/transcription elongation factor TFIIS